MPTVIETSMAAWSESHPQPDSLTLHFSFTATQCATEFEVQYRVYGSGSWNTLNCTTPTAHCTFNGNKVYEVTTSHAPCATTNFQWRAKAKNWNGWAVDYSAIKNFKAYCIEEP